MYSGRDLSGDINLKFDGGAGSDCGVSRPDFVEHGDGGYAGAGEGKGAKEADGFGTENGVEAGGESEDEKCGTESCEPAAIDNLVDVNASEADGSAFFEHASDGRSWVTAGGLEINQCREAAIESGILAVEHTSGEDGMDFTGESAQDKAVDDEQATKEHCSEEYGAGQRCETTADNPVIEEGEHEDVTDEQQSGEEGGGEQICGLNPALGQCELVADELVRFDELILLWFGDGGHDRTFVKKPRRDAAVQYFIGIPVEVAVNSLELGGFG